MTEPITELGVIVNDRDGMDKSNDRSFNVDEAVIPIRVPNDMFDRFVKAAQFHKYPTVEAWAESTLILSLTTKIGAPSIASPTELSGVEANKITGPKGGIVTRG